MQEFNGPEGILPMEKTTQNRPYKIQEGGQNCSAFSDLYVHPYGWFKHLMCLSTYWYNHAMNSVCYSYFHNSKKGMTIAAGTCVDYDLLIKNIINKTYDVILIPTARYPQHDMYYPDL